MKFVKLFTILLFVINACSDSNNPLSSNIGNQFIGGIGTEWTYKETERWLAPNSDTSYFNVPDSLISKVSLTPSQLKNGVVIISNYTENVEPIEESYYTSWKLPLPKENYFQIEGEGKVYSLENELKALQQNKNYSKIHLGIGPNIFRITDRGAISVLTKDLEIVFPPQPYIKNNLEVNDSWVREQCIDTATQKVNYETIAEVVGKEKISIEAGTFNAFKVKLSTHNYNINYTFEEGYEYYVPNVGLVLKEYDLDVYRWNSKTNITIHFRKIFCKELVSYNFIH